MRKHFGVLTGAAMAAVGLLLLVAALTGFSVGLPAVVPASARGASWLMVAVVLVFAGAFVGLAARGLELDAAEHSRVRRVRPVRHLHPTR
jgi:hypothetical protein